MSVPADRNLLFGILAMQMDFITRDQLVAAMHAWVLAKHRPLGEILVEHQALPSVKRELLEPLVDQHVKDHGDDPQRSLAALSSVSNIREELKAVPDADVQASLGLFARDSGKTGSYHAAPTDRHDISPLPVGRGGKTGAYHAAPTDGREGTRYRILRAHARGGLGEVFVARDTELNREIALKEIQSGKDRGDARARFVFEAEITGGLEHPGIVPVYGLGHYSDGRPYYAMRFVRGDNLGDAIKRFHQSPPVAAGGFDSIDFRRLLQRFIDVCNAIAYAHSRGVLHRDLKPGNIMLGKYGETLVVDWGLAKVGSGRERPQPEDDVETTLTPSSGSDVLPTQYGSILGTPAYMSPEQAEGKLDQLGPASDVYSLGATLYHLLVGKPANSDCDAIKMLARSQKGDIPPPRSKQPAIPKALDAICCKAMALKPSDRYATAQSMAADIEHWLADEPVGAHAEPLSERARRWVRKHRTFATSAALVGATTIIGLAIGLAAIDRQRKLVVAQEIATGKERDRADEEKRTAEAVLNFVEKKIFAAARPESIDGGLGHNVTLRKAIESSLPFVEKSFTTQPFIEARLRMTLGDSFLYLGEAQIAADQFLAARALLTHHFGPDHANTFASMVNLANAYANLGRHADALKLCEEVLELQRTKLGHDHHETLQSMNNLAVTYQDLGRHAEALKLCEETLVLRKAKLGPDHPETLQSMNNFAIYYAGFGRHAEALALFEQTLVLRKAKFGAENLDTIRSASNLANCYAQLGRHAEALKLREGALAVRKAKLGLDHPSTLRSMAVLAESLVQLDRGAEALQVIDECLDRASGKIVDLKLIPELMGTRLQHFVKIKDATGCRTTAEMWEKLNRTDVGSLYSAACNRAVTAAVLRTNPPGADAARLADAEADLAMGWLQKAVAAGYKNVEHMKKDTDLDALREREDFKKLLADLEATAAQPKKE